MIAKDKKLVNTILEIEHLESFKVLAKKKGTTVSGLIRMLVIKELENENTKQKEKE